ncbi:PLC-like phosphodiesterase [Hypoxylon sp. FL1284]|nr:PLC-like phosphodiesterase [Hypoxylon sp. FL1284]
MVPSLCTLLSAAAALSATAHAMPQDGKGSSTYSLAVASPGSAADVVTPRAATACNNYPDLCGRAYNEITHMGAHDSAFLRDASTDNSIAGNQYFNATVALDAGIRLLQAQVHNKNGAIELCHTSCDLLDAGTLEAWLGGIKTWMDGHPNEVVTLLLVNSDNRAAADFGAVFAGAGLDKYGYVPTSGGSEWPTLQDMISLGKRLVTFVASITPSPSYPYLLNEFDHVFETAFGVTDTAAFNCTLDRPASQSSASAALSAGLLPLINHFLDSPLGSSASLPDADAAPATNSPRMSPLGSLGLHAQTCRGQWGGARPTFVLVDFFNEGPAVATADDINGVSQPVGRSTAVIDAAKDAASTSTGAKVVAAQRQNHGLGTGALVAFLVASLVLV